MGWELAWPLPRDTGIQCPLFHHVGCDQHFTTALGNDLFIVAVMVALDMCGCD